MKVYAAINAVQAALSKEGIAKTRKNLQQGYSFRGIDEVMNALAPILATAQLCILPRVLTRETSERPSKAGGLLFRTILEMEFDFVHAEDGSKHTVRVVGEAMDSADKSCNKAMSASFKYACMQAFCIPTEGDNDADATTHEPVIQLRADIAPPLDDVRPDGFMLIDDVRSDGKFYHITWGRDAQGGAVVYKTKLPHIAARAQEAFDARIPVKLHSQILPWLDRVERIDVYAPASGVTACDV